MRGSREISLVPFLHRASTDALIYVYAHFHSQHLLSLPLYIMLGTQQNIVHRWTRLFLPASKESGCKTPSMNHLNYAPKQVVA